MMHEEADCGYDSCPRCRRKLPAEEAQRRALEEHKRRLRSGEWEASTEYTADDLLADQRIQAARRWGAYR